MSKDDIYNALCAVFFAEEIRLEDSVREIEYRMWQRGADTHTYIEFIQAQARLDYFRTYILDVLRYLNNFDR